MVGVASNRISAKISLIFKKPSDMFHKLNDGQGRAREEGGTALEWLALHRIAPIARFCAVSVPAHVFESLAIHLCSHILDMKGASEGI